ncbi:MAG: chemotaxis protein CheW [Vicinamibacteria bacterium]
MAENKRRTRKTPAPAAAPEPDWTVREEPLVPEPAPGRRLSLPSSGLAEDILAFAEQGGDLAPADDGGQALMPAPAPAPRTHNISFFAAPMREERQAVEASEHLATFFLSSEEYGVDVRLVQEIIRVSEITPVPRAPGFIKGVISLRGRIIPVVDLKRKLNLGEVDVKGRAARIAVVKVRERLIGLLVDGASQVLRVTLTRIEPAPEEVVEIDANYIRGVAKLEERLIILMDLPKILALELKAAGEEGSSS